MKEYELVSEFLYKDKKGRWIKKKTSIVVVTSNSSHINVQTNDIRKGS